MNERTKISLGILQAAFVTAVLCDLLFRAQPAGLSVPIVVAVFLIALPLLGKKAGRPGVFHQEGRWLLAATAFFSIAFVWRDSPVLRFFDALALLCLLSLLGLKLRGHKVNLSGITDYAIGGIAAAFNSGFSTFELLFCDIAWKEMPDKKWTRRGFAISRGLVVALPLVLIFGALLMSADAMFQHLVGSLSINFDPSHIVIITIVTWLTTGFLHGAIFGKVLAVPTNIFAPPTPSIMMGEASTPQSAELADTAQAKWFGITETTIVLGALDLLFLSFVLIQARYFFGGAALVQATTGLTYAEYARRGFFELVMVAALALPLLLAAHWMISKEPVAAIRRFRFLAVSMIGLLFVIMTSALLRMLLYQREYGLTEDRLYASALMIWLSIVFVWFSITVLRNQRQRFAWGALAAALFVMTTLHALNPDAFIVRVNMAHAQRNGRIFDARYNSSLSADAVPNLVDALPSLPPGARQMMAHTLLERWSPPERADWRTFNFARWSARKAVRLNNAQLWQEVQNGAQLEGPCGRSGAASEGGNADL
jgi:hypothetical protein